MFLFIHMCFYFQTLVLVKPATGTQQAPATMLTAMVWASVSVRTQTSRLMQVEIVLVSFPLMDTLHGFGQKI